LLAQKFLTLFSFIRSKIVTKPGHLGPKFRTFFLHDQRKFLAHQMGLLRSLLHQIEEERELVVELRMRGAEALRRLGERRHRPPLAPAHPIDADLPKELALAEEVRAQLERGRPCLILAWHALLVEGLADRLRRLLGGRLPGARGSGPAIAHLPRSVDARKREAWISALLRKGCDILVAQPRAIETGLNNLIHYPTQVWHENPGCNPYVRRQGAGAGAGGGSKNETCRDGAGASGAGAGAGAEDGGGDGGGEASPSERGWSYGGSPCGPLCGGSSPFQTVPPSFGGSGRFFRPGIASARSGKPLLAFVGRPPPGARLRSGTTVTGHACGDVRR
jgi:hypothetical protein